MVEQHHAGLVPEEDVWNGVFSPIRAAIRKYKDDTRLPATVIYRRELTASRIQPGRPGGSLAQGERASMASDFLQLQRLRHRDRRGARNAAAAEPTTAERMGRVVALAQRALKWSRQAGRAPGNGNARAS